MEKETQLVIGGVALPHRVILAPMAGVSDQPFRWLCRQRGAGLVCTEMVSAKGIQYGGRNTERLLQIRPGESPVSLQLFGSDPELVAETAKRIEERPFDILDLNMGCPVPKIVGNGEGAALMKDPALAERIIRRTVRAIQKPVTVKIRKGFDEAHVNAVEIAKAAEAAGAAAVAVHGRTREQFYAGEADWEIIARVREAVSIPVIGNGDVKDGESAARMLSQTGCDAVMVGRAARGNPWLAGRIAAALQSGVMPPPPPPAVVRDTILEHIGLQEAYRGSYLAVREMRGQIGWYLAGYRGSAAMRRRINGIERIEELRETIAVWFDEQIRQEEIRDDYHQSLHDREK